MANPEVHTGSAERVAEIQKAAGERSAELREQSRNKSESLDTQEERINEARATAEHEAKTTEEYRPSQQEAGKQGQPTFMPHSREASYKHTMTAIRHDMSAPERAFSKVIHNKTVEKISDVAGSTVARPNALLAGSVCAFLLVLGVYLIARYTGFALSGFESIAAFIIGWIIGVVFDFLRVMISGKR